MKFNRGAELDKQIYKEGEPTWGCKSGVLDVEDVKDFIKKLKEKIILYNKINRNETHWIIREIDELAGDKLI